MVEEVGPIENGGESKTEAITIENDGEESKTTPLQEQSLKSEIKNDPVIKSVSDSVTDLEKRIIQQIEYYFGDANLHKDKFLIEQISIDNGWVLFSTLLTFKRLASLSSDVDAIITALEKSEEGLIEISDDKTKLRRHPERPLPELNEEKRKEIISRTAYAKGFPLDTEISTLIDYFNGFEKVINVRMRKYHDKTTKTYKFKGSVFVTFQTKEQCDDFVEKDKVEYEGMNLIRYTQDNYFKLKKEEKINTEKKQKTKEEESEIAKMPKGSILYFKGCNKETTREIIKEAFEKYKSEVAYIEYKRGEEEGYIRFQKENEAKEVLQKIENGKLTLGEDNELNLRLLDGEEEKDYLKNVLLQMKNKKNSNKFNKGRNKNMKRKSKGEHKEIPAKK